MYQFNMDPSKFCQVLSYKINTLVVLEFKYLPSYSMKTFYKGHLECLQHCIITPQLVDKMLSCNTFLETSIQLLRDGIFIVHI